MGVRNEGFMYKKVVLSQSEKAKNDERWRWSVVMMGDVNRWEEKSVEECD